MRGPCRWASTVGQGLTLFVTRADAEARAEFLEAIHEETDWTLFRARAYGRCVLTKYARY